MGRWAGYWTLDDASDGKTRRHPYLYNKIFASLMSRQSASFASHRKRFVPDFEFS
jgi:hypothetical protein